MQFSFSILSISNDAKTIKGESKGYLTGIVYLAPSDLSGVINTCKFASPGCRASCLFTAGRGTFKNVIEARIRRTKLLVEDKALFYRQLRAEIGLLRLQAELKGMTPCVRLNGTSDIDHSEFMASMPDVTFYDYTKDILKMRRYLKGELPKNYFLTFSRSETNSKHVSEVIAKGGNVAVVFQGKQLPSEYMGRPVFNGDESDLRFLDPKGVIVGLTSKGKAKKDESGFAVSI